MKICPKCKAELTDNDMFCFVCGHKFEQQTLSQQNVQEGSAVLKPCPACQAVPASAEDQFCAECGAKLFQITPSATQLPANETQQPFSSQESQTSDETPVDPEPEKKEPIAETRSLEESTKKQPDVQQQPPVIPVVQAPIPSPPVAQYSTPGLIQSGPKKKKSTGKIVLRIILILLIIAVVGGGIGGFLIYNGNVSRKAAEQYIPKSLLDMIPVGKGSNSNTASRFFVVYCFGQFEKQDMKKGSKTETEKQAVISDIFTNVDAGSETNDKAEVVFRSAGKEQIKKFSRFSKFFVTSFSTNLEAMTERENIINDLKSKGYRPEFVRVVK